MNRTLAVCLSLGLILFAGCLTEDPTPDTRPADSAATFEEADTPPEPITIDETHDLTAGPVDKDWSFRIHPNATSATVRFALSGVADTPIAHRGAQMCFTIDSPDVDLTECTTANPSVQIEVLDLLGTVQDGITYYETTTAPAGTYKVHFDSLPTAATFEAHVHVQYD